MKIKNRDQAIIEIEPFDRDFCRSTDIISRIGRGQIGGKASGLSAIRHVLQEKFKDGQYDGISITIPKMVILATGVFDLFVERNKLEYLHHKQNVSDEEIARLFLRADFPAEYVGDLRMLISDVHTPLAIRSSSLLEDALFEPFAGVYATKMIPNNQPEVDTRFQKLIEAIKLVYASTFFKCARDYHLAMGRSTRDEKMALIIQEVFGNRYSDRFYPIISGVARSYNFYPIGSARPENGIVDLALGLGKTIVDGGLAWNFSPAFPLIAPPYGSNQDLLKKTQTSFWAVNMGRPPEYNPMKETEYLCQSNLVDAEYDNTLKYIGSTYLVENDKIIIGTGHKGPRIINFAPILKGHRFPLNELITSLLILCEEKVSSDVEIEFAVNISGDGQARFAFLQVRPMVVSREKIEIDDSELIGDKVLAASRKVLGNGSLTDIRDIVYVDPEKFNARYTQEISGELNEINRGLVEEKRPYLLIGFGRWGSSDPWLGIPVDWSQISGARIIIEATLPEMDVELSQGSHFFHNLSSHRVFYFHIHHDSEYKVNWSWLAGHKPIISKKFVHCLRLDNSLNVRVDGRSGKGVILK